MWYAVNAWRIGSCTSVGTGSYSIKTENNVNRYTWTKLELENANNCLHFIHLSKVRDRAEHVLVVLEWDRS